MSRISRQQFYNEGAYSATETESSTWQRQAMQIQTFAFGILFALLFILHGDTFYYYTHAKALE